jgi:succinyl-CoA synthetase alpha subunit
MVRTNAYFDSVTLMKVSGEISKLSGVLDVMVGMGTDLNKDSLKDVGIFSAECETASPNDLMIGIKVETENSLTAALNKIEELLTRRVRTALGSSEKIYERLEEVAKLGEAYNLAVISVPGSYAAREAKTALNNDMHVFLFSDNVTIEEEIELKELAFKRGLLIMGPDCGTAIINGTPLGFANRVRRGNIGIVGASGTGLQQVTTLIHELGAGISQAVGTGGRDLSAKVGGKTILSALEALKEDETTEVVVIISKPPAEKVADKVFAAAQEMGKPVVMCLLGFNGEISLGDKVTVCTDLEATAVKAVSLALGREVKFRLSEGREEIVENFKKARKPEQKYVRAIYGGGTLCDEAMTIFRKSGICMNSNIPLSSEEELENIEVSEGNTFLDMGEDYFTRGKPHPMIEPRLRNKRIIQEALDPSTAVMLLDVVLGHGSHEDPAGVAAEAAVIANLKLKSMERRVLWIAALVGTDEDPQGYEDQVKKLKKAGFIVLPSNVRAAKLAASIITGMGE